MRIGIDARVLDRKITGTGRFLMNLLNELPYIDMKNEYFLFTNSTNSFPKDFYKVIRYKESILPMKLYSPIWVNFKLPKLLKRYKIDLLFTANVLVPLIKNKNTKYISVVHDVIYKVYKEYYPFFYRQYLSIFLPKSLKNSDIIITVSHLSKNDIVKYFRIDKNKIRVIPNTVSADFTSNQIDKDIKSGLIKKYKLPNKYLLYVGVVEKRKNVLGIIKIIDKLRESVSKLELVIIGRPGYFAHNIIPEIEKRKNYISYINYIADQDLSEIYKSAFAFIFPSYYEGFGIPPLEAMQCGIPVLSSNTSALLEVVGDGGIMHDPDDYDSFVNDIIKLESDSKFYSIMKQKALVQSKKFNIKEATQKLVEIFNEMNN